MNKVKVLMVTEDIDYFRKVESCMAKDNQKISISRMEEDDNKEKDVVFNCDVLIIDETWLIKNWKINDKDREKRDDMIDELKNNWKLVKGQVALILCNQICNEGRGYIYKFSTLRNLANKILIAYENETGIKVIRKLENNSVTRIFSVISDEGGTGSSAISMGLLQDLAFENKRRCLYISLGKYHEEKKFTRSGRSNNLRELLYNMFYGDIKSLNSIELYINQMENMVYSFRVTTFKNKILELSQKQFLIFIEYILKGEYFDIILFDIGNNIDDICKAAVEISDKTVVVLRNINEKIWNEHLGYMGVSLDTYENYGENKDNKNIESKENNAIGVLNRVFTGNPKFKEFFEEDYKEEKYKEISVLIEEDTSSFQMDNQIEKIYLSGPFGIGIRQLSDIMIK